MTLEQWSNQLPPRVGAAFLKELSRTSFANDDADNMYMMPINLLRDNDYWHDNEFFRTQLGRRFWTKIRNVIQSNAHENNSNRHRDHPF